jgi:hypothetical protein
MSIISTVFGWVLALVGAVFGRRKTTKRVPGPGIQSPGRVFYPPIETTGETSPLSALKRAWSAVNLRSANRIETPVDRKAENESFSDLERLIKPTLQLCAKTGAIAKQARSGAPNEARGKASGVTAKPNLGQEIADHARRGDDMASHHAADSVIGTIFLSFVDATKADKPCPFKGVSKTGQPATDRTVIAYCCRIAAMVWSELVNGRARGVKRDADGVAIDPKQEKPVTLEGNEVVSREVDPAIQAEQTDPDMIQRIEEIVYFTIQNYPEDVIILWATSINGVEGMKPWEGIRPMKACYGLRKKMLAELGQGLELFRGPAVNEAIQRMADKYSPATV